MFFPNLPPVLGGKNAIFATNRTKTSLKTETGLWMVNWKIPRSNLHCLPTYAYISLFYADLIFGHKCLSNLFFQVNLQTKVVHEENPLKMEF